MTTAKDRPDEAYYYFIIALVRYLRLWTIIVVGSLTNTEYRGLVKGAEWVHGDLLSRPTRRHVKRVTCLSDGASPREVRHLARFRRFRTWKKTLDRYILAGKKLDLWVVGRQIGTRGIMNHLELVMPLMSATSRILVMDTNVTAACDFCHALEAKGWRGLYIGSLGLMECGSKETA